jgi:hypothetical protein
VVLTAAINIFYRSKYTRRKAIFDVLQCEVLKGGIDNVRGPRELSLSCRTARQAALAKVMSENHA